MTAVPTATARAPASTPSAGDRGFSLSPNVGIAAQRTPLGRGSGVVVPARELAAGELLDRRRVLGEAAAQGLNEVVGELGLRRRRLLGVVDDPLDDPAQRLGQAVEVAVEGAE